jgi:uncharacterized protein
MIGTALNAAGIVLGGGIGLLRKEPLSRAQEMYFKAVLGALTVFFGLRLSWASLEGTPWRVVKGLGIAVLSMSLGKVLGRLMGLQKLSNRIGQTARASIVAAGPDNPGRLDTGFRTCAVLFCAAPLGFVGAVQDGLSDYYFPLAIKGVMDALAAMGFVKLFGWGSMLSALPVFAFQGAISMLCARQIGPFLEAHGLLNSVNATGGLLVFSVGLVIFEIKKIELADYLPSLAIAPILTWFLR